MVESDPVGGVHLFFDVPGDDQVLSPAHGEVHRVGSERGAALGAHQVRVAVGARQPHQPGDAGPRWARVAAAALRQGAQVLWAEGVAQVGAAPALGRSWVIPGRSQVLLATLRGRGGGSAAAAAAAATAPARAAIAGLPMGAGPRREDGCG